MKKDDLNFIRQMWFLIGFFIGIFFTCILVYFMS